MFNKILIIPDLHLGAGINVGKPAVGSILPSRILDQLSILNWILETAMNNNVDCIIFTGDITESSQPSNQLLNLFREWLIEATSYSIEIHLIVGNHDLKRVGNNYIVSVDCFEHIIGVFIHKNPTTIYHSSCVGITLLPFRDRKSFSFDTTQEALLHLQNIVDFESQSIPYTYAKVLIGHFAIEGSIYSGGEIDSEANEIICPLNMFKNYDYSFFGHIHKPQLLQKNPHVSIVGSCDRSNFGEVDQNKIVVLLDPSNTSNFFTNVDIPIRPLKRIRLKITKANSTQFLLNFINDIDFNNALVKLEIQLDGNEVQSLNRKQIETFIYDRGAHYISGFTETKLNKIISLDNKHKLEHGIDPLTAIKLWAENNNLPNSIDKELFLEECKMIIKEVGF